MLTKRGVGNYGNYKLGDKLLSEYRLTDPILQPVVENLLNGDLESAIASLDIDIKAKQRINNLVGKPDPVISKFIDRMTSLRNDLQEGKNFSGERNIYKVNIHGKDQGDLNWLDWDKPITIEQRDLIYKNIKSISGVDLNDWKDDLGISEAYKDDLPTGSQVQELLIHERGLNKADMPKDKRISLWLNSIGIDGIRYKSEGGTGGRTGIGYNYVVFDENAISIDEHRISEPLHQLGLDLGNKQQQDLFRDNATERDKEITQEIRKEIDTERQGEDRGTDIDQPRNLAKSVTVE